MFDAFGTFLNEARRKRGDDTATTGATISMPMRVDTTVRQY